MAKPELKSKVKFPTQRTVHCRMSRGLTKWCFALCEPKHGKGPCGRPAAHAFRGRTQRAIARHNARQRKEEVSDSVA